MRRYYIYTLLWALTTTVGCSECDIVSANSEPRQQISFVDNSVEITRAANDNEDDFCVWALANEVGVGSQKWYFVDTFSSTSPSNNTAYYWPTNGVTLDFWAFSSSSHTSFMQSASDKQTITAYDNVESISLQYTVPAGAQDDLTMANPMKNCTDEVSSTVQLTFNHLLSKVIVEVKVADKLKGQYSLGGGYSSTLNVGYNAAEIHLAEPSAQLGSERYSLAEAPTEYNGARSYFVIPQLSSDISLTINNIELIDRYNQKHYEGDSGKYVIADGAIADNELKAGRAYKFLITIDDITVDDEGKLILNKILFDAKITDWESEDNEFNQEYK